MTDIMRLPFDNSYARLPDRFFARTPPTPVRAPRLLRLNEPLAEALGLDPKELASEAGVAVLAGNAVAEGSDPIALAYAGHQFGHFVPQLGDGRAILLGEVVGRDGKRRDVQLKGAGPTPFSRRGDGRAALGPVIREYVVSEAMAALGVPTTRALAAVATGERIYREEALPGAVLTRVASSHLRVGTFEYFAARGDVEAIGTLVLHAIERHYPASVGAPNAAVALLEHVIDAQATLVAGWLGVGFVHGVMNTDNTSVAGETIDYGPCAFLDEYDARKRFSSIDHGGRYAFANQPRIAHWNVVRLAETLLPLLDEDEDRATEIATERLKGFPGKFEAAYAAVLRRKLGLATEEEGDLALAQDLLERMQASAVDYTVCFRRLATHGDSVGGAGSSEGVSQGVAALFDEPGAFASWAERWRARLAKEGATPESRASAMRRASPAFIPRNHRVEEAIRAAVDREDLGPFETLVRVLARPYDDQPEAAPLAEPPTPSERVTQTFCGT